VLDEPTNGLHLEYILNLAKVFDLLLEQGHTLVLIEHNLDVIKLADWLIDLGPEGGVGGGRVVAMGRPEDVAKVEDSHTGRWLAPLLERRVDSMEISPRIGSALVDIEPMSRQLAL
jgi:excinuclease ABC subunit A